MIKLTTKGQEQVIRLVEQSMTSQYDEIVVMHHNDAQCFELVDGNPYRDAILNVIQKVSAHYGCSWRTAEDIVARVTGWIFESDNAPAEHSAASADMLRRDVLRGDRP